MTSLTFHTHENPAKSVVSFLKVKDFEIPDFFLVLSTTVMQKEAQRKCRAVVRGGDLASLEFGFSEKRIKRKMKNGQTITISTPRFGNPMTGLKCLYVFKAIVPSKAQCPKEDPWLYRDDLFCVLHLIDR